MKRECIIRRFLPQNWIKWLIVTVCSSLLTTVTLIAIAWFMVNKNEQGLDYKKALAITQAFSGQDIDMNQAYLALKSYGVQPSDCYICSATGCVPDPVANVINKEPFEHYKITAYVISGREYNEEDTIPLTISVGSEKETWKTNAKASRLTSCFYMIEFDLPRKIIEDTPDHWRLCMQCGDGEKIGYAVLSRKWYHFYLFMDGQSYPKLPEMLKKPDSSSFFDNAEMSCEITLEEIGQMINDTKSRTKSK